MELMRKHLSETIVKGFFLLLFNSVLMIIPGFMIIDSNANLNSRIGGFLLSILIPYVIVSKTREMDGMERMFKFGVGYMLYIILALIIPPLKDVLYSGLLPCLLISIWILYTGKEILKRTE